MRRMFLLYSRGHGAAVSPRWESEARALSCPKCKTLLVSNCAPNVVMANRPEDTVIGFFYSDPIRYTRNDFLHVIGVETQQRLLLGTITIEGKGVSREYSTYVPKGRALLIRGGKESAYRGRCATCGALRYLPIGDHHVLKRELTDGSFFVWDLGFVVDEHLMHVIQKRNWPKLGVQELSIVDEPQDGLPVDL